MKSLGRILLRVLFLIVVAALLLTGGVLAWFSSWRAGRLVALHAGGTMAETPAGAIQYATEGDGAPVLVVHGAPGGYDQALLWGADLAADGFQVVAPSRPGYLGTPATVGISPEQQADALAALVEGLVGRPVVVFGVSFGAPVAIEVARRHPNQVRALVLVSPVVKPPARREPLLPEQLNRILTGDVGSWMLLDKFERDPAGVVGTTLELTASDPSAQDSIVSNPEQKEWLQKLFETFAPINPRESGLRNDVLQTRALSDFPWDEMTVPTLLIRGEKDIIVPQADLDAVVAKLPQGTLVTIPAAGHLVPLGPQADAYRKAITDFLARYRDPS